MFKRNLFLVPLIILGLVGSLAIADEPVVPPKSSSMAGLYKTLLLHKGTKFYQPAYIQLTTTNIGEGKLKVSANVRVFFGETTGSEYISYEFENCGWNLLTGMLTIQSEKNNVWFVGRLRSDKIEGDWHSSVTGHVGAFKAVKDVEPTPPADSLLVKTLTGHYRGQIVNTNPESNIPERVAMSLVTTQDTSLGTAVMKTSGNVRLYVGDFGSLEYVETKLTDVQFNFFNRILTAKTVDYGITFKGSLSHDGTFTGTVLADGLGEAGTTVMKRMN